MKIIIYTLLLSTTVFLLGCNSGTEKPVQKEVSQKTVDNSAKEMLTQAYQLFKEGNDEKSIELANKVLAIGRETKNDTLVGKALTSLCRNAQRSLDTTRLTELSDQLVALSSKTGDQKWMMYRAHMNAEMWRLIGDMDKAEDFYEESLKISFLTGAKGMYIIDHFNKSFVATAKGEYREANELIRIYYQLRKAENLAAEDAYGLISLAYLLEQQQNYKAAHEVAVVTRRLFKEQNLFPEPPDEKPLLMVEKKVKEMLKQSTLDEINKKSTTASVASLLEKYL